MDKEEKAILISLDNKLTLLVNLLMRKEELSIKDKVVLTDNMSLSNKDASKILGISESHYAKEKSLLKKRIPNNDRNIDDVNNKEVQNDKSQVQQQS